MDYPDLAEEVANNPDLVNKLASFYYARSFYAALCNNEWRKEGYDYTGKEPWAVTWRTAGGITAGLHNNSGLLGNYLEFYCSGGEGHVDSEVEQDLYELGWTWEPIRLN